MSAWLTASRMQKVGWPALANPGAKAQDTGRLAVRNPEVEPYPDERPTLYWPHKFWKDEEEHERYERAAKLCPVSASGSLTLDEYLGEVVKLAEGIKPQAPAVKTMPGGSR